MSVSCPFPRLIGAVLSLAAAVSWSQPVLAYEPEFFDVPFADGQWNIGRRLDESKLRYCVDPRDPGWEVAAEIADAIAGALLLEPERYVVQSEIISEDITKVYELLLKHCDMHMGFKLIPDGYATWSFLTRPYFETDYAFVTTGPALEKLGDLEPGGKIGATLGTSAHLRLVSYLTAMPAADRWSAFPMGTNTQALDSLVDGTLVDGTLVDGTVDVALVWAPTLWAMQRNDPTDASLHVISPAPLPPTTLGVGALMLSNQTFLRTAVDEAIAALSADGTLAGILESYGFPAVVP